MKRKTLLGRRLSDALPDVPEIRLVKACALEASISRLVGENLRGAATITVLSSTDGYVEASIAHLAYYLRLITKEASEKFIPEITLRISSSSFDLLIAPLDKISDSVLSLIDRTAASSGFSVHGEGNFLCLSTKLINSTSMSLYAPMPDGIYDIFLNMFFS